MEWGYGRGTLLCLIAGIIMLTVGAYLALTASTYIDPNTGRMFIDPALVFGLGLFILGSMFFGLAVAIFIAWLIFSRELPELFKR